MDFGLEPMPAVQTTAGGQRILDAASRLFYEQGITATGVDQIAEEAGTTKRTLYQRFGSKDALIGAYLQQRAHRWQAELLTSLVGQDPTAGVRVVYDQARRWAEAGRRGCAFFNAWAELSPRPGEGTAVVQAEKRWMLHLFTQLAGEDQSLGRTLFLVYEGAQVTASVLGDLGAFDPAESLSSSLLPRTA